MVNNPFNKNTKSITLPVHVVCSRSGVISEPDTEVLDFQRVLLLDLLARHDLSGGLLELTKLTKEIPKPNRTFSINQLWSNVKLAHDDMIGD